MAFNKQGGKDIPLSVFGGLVTEQSPNTLPEGVSPYCRDVVFAPGLVASRPALIKRFGTPFPAGGPSSFVPTITYAKTFNLPTGDVENLYLDSNGSLYYEDVTNNPGVYTKIASVTPGSYAKSVTAFGREYIAISDGLHGSDVPLQWDGANLNKVTQDGPGAPPVVTSVTLPPVEMEVSTSLTLTPVEADPATLSGGQYTQINIWTSSSVTGILVGQQITLAGYTSTSAPMNGTWTITAIYPGSGGGNSLVQLAALLPSTTTFSTATAGITWTVLTGVTMQRANNIVTVTTSEPHNLQPGYQAQITGIPAAAVGGGIAFIVIANENLPGEALITTNSAHGLLPGCQVSLTGVAAVAVGGYITGMAWAGGLVTVTTNVAHGLVPGANVTISAAGTGSAAYNTTATVVNVMSPTTFTYVLVVPAAPATNPYVGSSVDVLALNWPIPDGPDPTYFEVITAPTATTFTVQITYCDSTFTSGTITFAWDGTFFVLAVPASDVFQYQQYGPNATTTTPGEVTPYGQAAPGIHQCQVSFLTRNGYITAPSPPVTFIANGGQYVSLTQIPVAAAGSDVVGRVVQFTGAGGAYFFYIPVPALENGQQVSTATQINDNTTTTALFDFSDNTLFAGIGVSIPGNTLQAQIPIEGALGFGFYASRLITWGQRNRIANLLNMDFEGGLGFVKSGQTFVPAAAAVPLGWTANGGIQASAIAADHFGSVWKASATAGTQVEIEQGAYLDAYGNPIATPNATYRLRVWLKSSVSVAGAYLLAVFSSSSTSFSSSAQILSSAMNSGGGYVESPFNNPMPTTIPPDLVFALIWDNTTGAGPDTCEIDEVSVLYADDPYNDTEFLGSYTENPEAFDGLSGVFGSSEDTAKIMDLGGIIRETLYFLTQDPSGRLHQTQDNGVTEPSGWTVGQVAANCGLLSAFGCTRSQQDDATASGGEEWFAWASVSGARIFGGDQPWKISQEIQDGGSGLSPTWASINPLAYLTVWAMNDPVQRTLYFGIPSLLIGTPSAPTYILTMNYRELDTAYQIATSPPVHISFTGRLIASDHTRKWAPWTLAMNGAAILATPGILGSSGYAVQSQPAFFNGNGQLPGVSAGFGNVYTLNSEIYADEDYGQIFPVYATYFFPSHDAESALFAPNGGGRKLLQYVQAFVSGVGQITISFSPDSISNVWALTVKRQLSLSPTFDLECAGGNAQGQRIALTFATAPTTGIANGFSLQKVVVTMKLVTHLPVRGAA